MCGICGKVYLDPERAVTPQELARMAATMMHRGPDGEGVWTEGHVGLAHRRLSIIDLRAVAGQPMSNEDGSVWVTFNGEIYNFRELRIELERQGHVFRTHSDTEVIVHAYEAYGRKCLERFRGMFAFAIWDNRTRSLFLARDRVGKKPLYYALSRDRFLFASEIKAILAEGSVSPALDPIALDHYLALRYIPAPRTAFRGVHKLPAGHWLELHAGRLEIGRYWQLHYTPKRHMDMRDAIAELRWHFAEAVRLRLVSDVPLGAFLSGGIDSSAVVACMAEVSHRPVQTFSVGFTDAAFDERPFARLMAERYGTTHTELVVKAPVSDILPRLVWHYDELLGDASAVPSYAIAELTRQHVTVVLNGDGGDENFAGYDWYVRDRLVRSGECIPRWLWQRAAALAQRLPGRWQQHGLGKKAVRLAEVLALAPERRYAQWVTLFSAAFRQQLYTDAFKDMVTDSDPEGVFGPVFAHSDAEDCTDRALDADVNLFLQEDLLVKMDRATMAHSLEARSPFLDHVLMEFVATLPPALKLAGRQKKRLLRAALRSVVPDAILDRPKMGFCAPLATWFREDLHDLAHDVLLSPRALQRGCFRPQMVARLLHEHQTGLHDHGESLWELLVLEMWQRTFLDNEGAIPRRGPQSTTSLV
jgi:asparagine synthase (glutamine-hydrolysing)